MRPGNPSSERVLIYAPLGRDATIAASLLGEAGLRALTCRDVADLHRGVSEIAGMVILTEESVRTANLAAISDWVTSQPPWSDMPFVVLTARGGGVERNPSAARLSKVFGNITFLERPFHPTTLISVAQTALRGRRRQYEARAGLDELRLGEARLMVALSAEKVAVSHQRLLIDELNHRVKNTLATMQSLAMQTLRSARTPEEAFEGPETRLLALSRAHDVLTRENWDGASLGEVVTQAIAPYRDREGLRFRVEGPEVRLNSRMSLAFAMALQELATNVVKYGALSDATGVVAIDWSVGGGEAARRLSFRWLEQAGPVVAEPLPRGFGTRLIERSLARDLDGHVTIVFEPAGVACTIVAPLA